MLLLYYDTYDTIFSFSSGEAVETGEAVEDTFCIMTCGGLPTMELQCASGSWDTNLDEIKCP